MNVGITECRACKAKIIFVPMESGKFNPVDAEPAANGNILIDDGIGRMIQKGAQVAVGTPLYISHFATCPEAKRFKK